MDTTALTQAMALAKTSVDRGMLRHTQICELRQLTIALYNRLGVPVPKYRTLRGQYRDITDVSRLLSDLYYASYTDTIPKVPSVKLNRLRYLLTLRRFRSEENHKNLLTLLKAEGVQSISFTRIKELTNLDFAITATQALCPEERPYWFGPYNMETVFDHWATGKPQPIEDVLRFGAEQINQIVK